MIVERYEKQKVILLRFSTESLFHTHRRCFDNLLILYVPFLVRKTPAFCSPGTRRNKSLRALMR